MRINVEGGPEAARDVHWRGIALTTFDGRRWDNGSHDPATNPPSPVRRWFPLGHGGGGKAKNGQGNSIHGAARADRQYGAVLHQPGGKRARTVQWRGWFGVPETAARHPSCGGGPCR